MISFLIVNQRKFNNITLVGLIGGADILVIGRVAETDGKPDPWGESMPSKPKSKSRAMRGDFKSHTYPQYVLITIVRTIILYSHSR